MNTTNKTITFAAAVLDTILSFTKNQESFSAYDVTRRLRNRVNALEFNLSDGAPTYVGGARTFSVPHPQVRQIVRDVFSSQNVTGYDTVDNGLYVTYTFNGVNSALSQPNTTLQTTVSNLKKPSNSLVNVAKSTGSVFNRLAKLDDADRAIVEYLGKKHNQGYNPSLKEIQSTLRRKGAFTCSEIETRINKLGDYKYKFADSLSRNAVCKK